eukprot:scaffold135901_cov217-Phaeocystis_antarctica.AAC.1
MLRHSACQSGREGRLRALRDGWCDHSQGPGEQPGRRLHLPHVNACQPRLDRFEAVASGERRLEGLLLLRAHDHVELSPACLRAIE